MQREPVVDCGYRERGRKGGERGVRDTPPRGVMPSAKRGAWEGPVKGPRRES